MQEQIEHKIFSSFREWFEHTLLAAGCYKNVSGNLYQMDDPRLSENTYSAPFYQWVYDQSITGALIPTASGLSVPHVDYINGRTIGGAPTGIVGYSVKDFNIYTTTKTEEKLIFEEKFTTTPNPFFNSGVTGLTPYQIVAPCIFLIPMNFKINENGYGGDVKETLNFKALVMADNEFDRFGVGMLFAKKKHTIFPYFEETPLNYYGDFKTGGYNYINQVEKYNSPDRFIYIDDVAFSPIEEDVLKKIHPNLSFATIQFNCCFYTNLERRTF